MNDETMKAASSVARRLLDVIESGDGKELTSIAMACEDLAETARLAQTAEFYARDGCDDEMAKALAVVLSRQVSSIRARYRVHLG